MKTTTTWLTGQQFGSEHEGNHIKVDGDKINGHGPKALLLSGLAGCSGIDVVDILVKKRVEFSDLVMIVEADTTEEYPKVFKDITITYQLKTSPNNAEKIKKAIELSLDKYCGVSAMLKKNSAISYKLEIVQ
jgi:putative redox protein